MKNNITKILASVAFAIAIAFAVAPTSPKAYAAGATINLKQFNLFNGSYSIAASSTNSVLLTATNTITFSAPPTNNESITFSMIGAQAVTYTFEPTYTNFAGMVLSDTSAANAAANLANAINLGANSGSKYGALTLANPYVTATVVNSTNVVVTAIVPGPDGNKIAVLVNSTNIYQLLSVQCSGGFMAQTEIIPVNGCGLSVSYKCATNAVGVGTNFVRVAYHLRGTKVPTTGTSVFTMACPYTSNACSTELTVTTNVPTSVCGNMREATVIGVDSSSTNSPTITDVSVNTEPTQ